MPRKARNPSYTGIYHAMVRGINRQVIFFGDRDYQRYLNTLYRVAANDEILILGYCLMNNHVHLLIKENTLSISTFMKKVGTSYAYWYNKKHERSGHVFQDRFKSEAVEDDSYLLTAIRYIHHNPVKAGIVDHPELYPWSSCQSYYGIRDHQFGPIETSLILSLFSEDMSRASQLFRSFMNTINDQQCLDVVEQGMTSDRKARDIIQQLMEQQPITVSDLSTLPKSQRDFWLHKFKQEGLSLRQIARITGVGYQTVNRA